MRRSKYSARKTEIDGVLFDSKKEANRYCELKLLEKGKVISNLELQPKFELAEGFRYQGKKYQAINYIADFKYVEENGIEVIEDVKGMKTDVYNIKKKLFLLRYGERFDFREI